MSTARRLPDWWLFLVAVSTTAVLVLGIVPQLGDRRLALVLGLAIAVAVPWLLIRLLWPVQLPPGRVRAFVLAFPLSLGACTIGLAVAVPPDAVALARAWPFALAVAMVLAAGYAGLRPEGATLQQL